MARKNVIAGNLFVVNGDGRMCFARCEGYRVEGNVLVASGSWTFESPEEGVSSWPKNWVYSREGSVVWKKLSVYNPVGTTPWKAVDGSRTSDPGLVAPFDGNVNFKEGAPAGMSLKPLWKDAGLSKSDRENR
jgi:hypothetical protein